MSITASGVWSHNAVWGYPILRMTDDLDPEETPEPKNDVPENQETGTPDPDFPDEDDASVAQEPVTEGDQ